MIYMSHKGRELLGGVHARRVRPSVGCYGCPFCNRKVNNTRMSLIQHALGRAASHTHGYASRVAHAALAEFLEGV